jgi:hypothetical protein
VEIAGAGGAEEKLIADLILAIGHAARKNSYA